MNDSTKTLQELHITWVQQMQKNCFVPISPVGAPPVTPFRIPFCKINDERMFQHKRLGRAGNVSVFNFNIILRISVGFPSETMLVNLLRMRNSFLFIICSSLVFVGRYVKLRDQDQGKKNEIQHHS
jgi:hypothetical protein